MFYKFVAALALSLAALPAAAQDQPVETVDGWYFAKVRDGVCQMVSTLKGETMISFIASDTLPGMIVLVDLNWQLKDGAPYEFRYSSDGWRTSQTVTVNARRSSSGRYTMGAPLEIPVTQRIRGAKRLAVRVPALNVDGEVTFTDGSLAALGRCIAG